MEGYFSYLSSLIFKKEQWNSIEFDKSFIGTAYAHTYILLSLLKEKIKLKYINNPIIIHRTGNDSFACDGFVRRLKLDFDGYKKLFTVVFKDNKNLSNYYNVFLKNSFSYIDLAGLYQKSEKQDRKLLVSFVKETHNIYMIKILSFFIFIYRKLFKKIFIRCKIHKFLSKKL